MVLRAPHCLVLDLVNAAEERRVVVINLAVDPVAPEVVVPRAKQVQETTFILPLQKPFQGKAHVLSKGEELIVRPRIKLLFGGMLVLSLD